MSKYQLVLYHASRLRERQRVEALLTARNLERRREQEIAESVLLNSLGLPRKGNYVERDTRNEE